MNSVNVGDVSVYVGGELVGKLVGTLPASGEPEAAGDDDRDWAQCGCDACACDAAADEAAADDGEKLSAEQEIDGMLASDAPATVRRALASLAVGPECLARYDGVGRALGLQMVYGGVPAPELAAAIRDVLYQRLVFGSLSRLTIGEFYKLAAALDGANRDYAALQDERDELVTALAAARAERDAARVIRGQVADERDDVEAERDALKDELRHARHGIEKLSGRVAWLETEPYPAMYDEAIAERDALRAELENLQARYNVRVTLHDITVDRACRLFDELTEVRAELAATRERYAELADIVMNDGPALPGDKCQPADQPDWLKVLTIHFEGGKVTIDGAVESA